MIERFDPVISEWVTFAQSHNFNLVEKCLKMSQLLEYPNLDIDEYIKKITDAGLELKESITDSKDQTYLISKLNQYFFDNMGFSGDLDDYYNPKNNFLNDVFDKKSGIPITLSILYAEIGKFIGLELKIIGFPSHILVKSDEEHILDPFNDGRLVDIDDLQLILDRNFGGSVEFDPNFLNEIESEKILLRMVRNLKNSYLQSYAYDKALKCIDMILALEPESAEELRDKGVLEERMMNHKAALEYLNQYLEINPNAEDVDFVLDLIRSVRDKINQ